MATRNASTEPQDPCDSRSDLAPYPPTPFGGEADAAPSVAVVDGHTLAAIGLVTLVALVATGCGGDDSAVPGNSLRVLTYNVHLLSRGMGGPGGPFDRARAEEIADQAIAGGFDIVALQEVWDEDSKDEFVNQLGGTFPHYVQYVDKEGAAECWLSPLCIDDHDLPFGPPMLIPGEDSGLMIFSKFEFVGLHDHHYKSKDNESSEGHDYEQIGYAAFEDCHDSKPCCECLDCCAAKGAVLARFRHDSGRVINVVSSHTQADDKPGRAEIRMRQMNQIRARNTLGPGPQGVPPLIDRTLDESPHSWTGRQWLLMMGDLNFDGLGAVRDNVIGDGAFGQPVSQEWNVNVGALTDSGYGLYDAWAETTSPLDPGPTSSDGKRLDYILASRRNVPLPAATPDLCVQHVWNPPEFVGLSDHRPVAADINLTAEQCNPRSAYSITPEDAGSLDEVDGREGRKLYREIVHPGGMQWFLLNDPGGYAIALDPDEEADGLSLEVYPASNLSAPLSGAYEIGETTIHACDYSPEVSDCREVPAREFVLPTGPHYVRVFYKDRGPTDPYWIAFYRFTCKSRDERCVLTANEPQRMVFPPAGIPLNSQDEAWFEVDVREQADSGARQTLRFIAREIPGDPWSAPGLILRDDLGGDVGSIDGSPLVPAPVTPGVVGLQSDTDSPVDVFFLVRRSDVNSDLTFEAMWQTDLVLVGGEPVGAERVELVCHDETNPELGSDEIDLEVNIDGAGWTARGHAVFECNQALNLSWESQLGVIRYLDSLHFRIVELDSGNPDDITPAIAAPTWLIETDAAGLAGRHFARWGFSGGDYELRYNVGKSRR